MQDRGATGTAFGAVRPPLASNYFRIRALPSTPDFAFSDCVTARQVRYRGIQLQVALLVATDTDL